jgi:hypothetical protein
MFTPRELTRFRLIKQMAQNGQAAFVSRADKQWVLDIMARENCPCRSSPVRYGRRLHCAQCCSGDNCNLVVDIQFLLRYNLHIATKELI